jgi:hypothetical protein
VFGGGRVRSGHEHERHNTTGKSPDQQLNQLGRMRDGIGYNAGLLNAMSWFLVLGAAWWYGIGCGVVFLIDRSRSTATTRTMQK